jgi:vancomycin resistance protein VanW
MIIFARRARRNVASCLNPKLSQRTENAFYEHIASRHQSVLFRRLGDSNPRLQRQKVINLKVAAEKLSGLVIPPGKTFSFWRAVGNPTHQNGFVDGMLLANGVVVEGSGGGLCQLSNLIYWLFLHTPITVTERHRHALDVFPDSGRVLPFGSGATILYNYIDLQAKNRMDYSFQLKIWVTDKHLKGQVLSSRRVPNKYHIFEKHHCFIVHRGRHFRFNEIWREELIQGQTQRVEKITTNFAPVMYPVDEAYIQKNGFQVWRLE